MVSLHYVLLHNRTVPTITDPLLLSIFQKLKKDKPQGPRRADQAEGLNLGRLTDSLLPANK